MTGLVHWLNYWLSELSVVGSITTRNYTNQKKSFIGLKQIDPLDLHLLLLILLTNVTCSVFISKKNIINKIHLKMLRVTSYHLSDWVRSSRLNGYIPLVFKVYYINYETVEYSQSFFVLGYGEGISTSKEILTYYVTYLDISVTLNTYWFMFSKQVIPDILFWSLVDCFACHCW